jgi:hypothetical protein
MAFNTFYRTHPIAILPEGAETSYAEILEDVPTLASDGWDSLKRRVLVVDPTITSVQAAIDEHYPRSGQLPGLNMWVTDATGRQVSGGIFLLEIDARGIFSARGYKIATSAAVSVQSAQNIFDADNILRPKIEVAENQVTCDVSYISLGAAPRTNLTGRNATPPSAPPTPATIWGWLVDPTYHYPNGWVLMASDGEGLPGVALSTVCLVTDRYQFIHSISP